MGGTRTAAWAACMAKARSCYLSASIFLSHASLFCLKLHIHPHVLHLATLLS